jgi:hypothetical protein
VPPLEETTIPMTRRLDRSRITRLLVVAAFAFLLAACGGGSAATGDAPAKSGSAKPKPAGAATADAKPAVDFTVDEFGYTLESNGSGGYYVEWAALLTNPNTAQYGAFPTVTITARDSHDGILGTDTQVLNGFPPSTTIAFASQIESDDKPAKVEVTFTKVDWYPTKTTGSQYKPFTASGIRWGGDQYSHKVVGELTNPWPSALEQIAVTALYRNANGRLIGGSTDFLDALPASGKVPFSVMDMSGLKKQPDNIEIYAMPWGGQPDEWNQLVTGKS